MVLEFLFCSLWICKNFSAFEQLTEVSQSGCRELVEQSRAFGGQNEQMIGNIVTSIDNGRDAVQKAKENSEQFCKDSETVIIFWSFRINLFARIDQICCLGQFLHVAHVGFWECLKKQCYNHLLLTLWHQCCFHRIYLGSFHKCFESYIITMLTFYISNNRVLIIYKNMNRIG